MTNNIQMNQNKDEFIFYSSGGFDLLEKYLCMLYGEQRGCYVNNIRRYFNGIEFEKMCSEAYSLNDIPEVTEEQILGQIAWEDEMRSKAEKIIQLYDEHTVDESLTEEDYLAIAGLLGLAGGNCDWYETLFPHTVNLFVSSLEEQSQINNKVHDNVELIKLMDGIMLDGMRDGQVLEIKGKKYWSQGYARNYFRGENAYYVTSRPSLMRGLPEQSLIDGNSEEDKKVKETIRIGILRETEFAFWTKRLNFVRQWPFRIYDGAIGQHYGLKTPYMDVTSNIYVALFFACCVYENDKWRPLKDEEFAERDSRKNVAELGGDSRYGVIFFAPVDILSMNAALKYPYPFITKVQPIGYQPFMRSVNQSGYVIEGNLQYDMYRDCSFGKVRFRHTRSLCDWIFTTSTVLMICATKKGKENLI